MPSVDEMLASSPLAGLYRVSRGGGDRPVALIRLAERFAELDDAPAGSLVVLSRAASAEVTDYRLDMALRWATVNRVSAVAAFAAEQWAPTVTAMDIAGRADIALISIPAHADLAGLVQSLLREIGGGADLALGRAQQGLDAVLHAEAAGASLDGLREAVSRALGTPVEFRPRPTGNGLALTPDGSPARTMPSPPLACRGARSLRSVCRCWSVRRSSATSPRRRRSVTWLSRSGWCCTTRPRPLAGCSTWPGRPARSRPGRAANCSPSC